MSFGYLKLSQKRTNNLTLLLCRPVVPGCAGCAMAHSIFRRSVNPISTRGDRLCPPNYYWHTQIFRPSDGPEPLYKGYGLGQSFRPYFHVHILHKTAYFNGLSFSQEILETSKNKLVKTLMRKK